MKHNYSKFLHPIRYCDIHCDGCKEMLSPTDLIVECPDCGSIFCKECVEDDIYSTHLCEDYVNDDQWDPIKWREDDVALFKEGYWCD